jgi:predicted nucleotidyltransferase
MVTEEEIRDITTAIVEAVHPRSVYLFGSYATGKQHPGSDLDFLIVMPDRSKKKYEIAEEVEKRTKTAKAVAKDLVVEYADYFDRFSGISYSFIGHIVKTGRLLYES